jgi:release factor glutamine methyltransferase
MTCVDVVARLRAAGCVAAEEEAALFLGRAPDARTLEMWLQRRECGEPVPWITGVVEFCGRPLRMVPGVFVPRLQSEELARRAARALPDRGRALDLCTGAGAVAAHLGAEHPAASVIAVDIDPVAARCAQLNGVPAVVGDLGDPVRDASFDVVTAVPPYVPTSQLRLLPPDVQRHEPRRALDGGRDGLAVAARVVEVAARVLCRGGWVLVEVGGDQDRLLTPRLEALGFGEIEPWRDDEGDLRGVVARCTG